MVSLVFGNKFNCFRAVVLYLTIPESIPLNHTTAFCIWSMLCESIIIHNDIRYCLVTMRQCFTSHGYSLLCKPTVWALYCAAGRLNQITLDGLEVHSKDPVHIASQVGENQRSLVSGGRIKTEKLLCCSPCLYHCIIALLSMLRIDETTALI